MKKWIGLFNVKPMEGNNLLGENVIGAFERLGAASNKARSFIMQNCDKKRGIIYPKEVNSLVALLYATPIPR